MPQSGCISKGVTQMISVLNLNSYRFTPVFAFLVAGVALGATDHAAILQEAAQAMDDAYTETTIESEEHTVGRYDPRQPVGERWQLLSVNSREPTAEEITDYAEDKEYDNGSSSADNGDHDVSDIAEPDSLRLIEETDDYWLYSFTPVEDDDEEFMTHVVATMKIIKNGPYIEHIDMHSNKPFKPQFGVKVKEFVTLLRFGLASNEGPVVPLSVDVRIKARAFLAIGIDEKMSVSFSDYEYVGN
jgi:hypothetical protein